MTGADDGNGQLTVSGFGLSAAMRGSLLIVMVLLLSGIGFLVWQTGVRLEHHMTETVRHLEKEHATRSAEHRDLAVNLANALARITCLLNYTAEERRAIRRKIEENPELAGMWCP